MVKQRGAGALGKHCAFCGKKEGLLEGVTFFRKDGSSQYYCSKKCRRNAELKRKPRKTKWVREAGKGSVN